MKKFSAFVMSLWMVSGMAGVQAREYDESIYLLRTSAVESNTEAAYAKCDDLRLRAMTEYGVMLPSMPPGPVDLVLLPTGAPNYVAATAKYYSMTTRSNTGKVVKDKVREVGGLVSCQDWTTWPSVALLYEVTLDGRTFMAHGGTLVWAGGDFIPWRGGSQLMAWQIPGGLPVGFPELGVGLYNNSLTVLPATPAGIPLPDGSVTEKSRGGTLTVNLVIDYLGEDDEYESMGIHVIRLYTPVEENPWYGLDLNWLPSPD